MDKFAPLSKFARVQINLRMCKSGHENGAKVTKMETLQPNSNKKLRLAQHDTTAQS